MLLIIGFFLTMAGVVGFLIALARVLGGPKPDLGPIKKPSAHAEAAPAAKKAKAAVHEEEEVETHTSHSYIVSWTVVGWALVLAMVGMLALFIAKNPPSLGYVDLGWIDSVRSTSALVTLGALLLAGFIFWKSSGSTRLIAAAAVVVVGIFFLKPSLLPSLTWPPGWFSNYQKQQLATSAACPGEPKVVDLNETPIVINPGARCYVRWKLEGVAFIIDRSGKKIRVDEKSVYYPSFRLEYAQSAQAGTVRMHYMLTIAP